MERGFLDKVKDNAAVRIWSESMQQEKCDSLVEGYVSALWDFTLISMTQNNLQDLKVIWDQWGDEIRQLLYSNYGDLPYLLDIKVDKHLFRALTQYWNPAYSCFSFGKVDLVPTVEEYTALLRCPKVQVDKAYSRAANVSTLLKKLMNIAGMSEQWVATQIKQKRDSKCIYWKILQDLILAHPDVKKKVDVFALNIYGLVIFRKALKHIDEAVSDLFDRLDKGVTHIPTILAETFRSLNARRRAGEGRFIGCAQLLLWSKRVNDNIHGPREKCVRSIEEHLQVVPSELEIIKQDFDKRSSELRNKIEQLEEENMRLGLDVDIHKLEAEKLRKGKNKVEEDLGSLKMDYKKLRLSIRTSCLGKASE
ncbi:hypothetical protein Goshw_000914 [Gossypium schwendimanii]|uniref:DUF7745 domain-containing protein n=1 Tax=Gossypium schwendimanii TaxID=34291 RepID=A0A7J9NAT2_GOSSC|nr:hypothetical protein [Gossypium schwendimanii]